MANDTQLSAGALRRACAPDEIPFETTSGSKVAEGTIVGQARATEALRFGIGVRRRGYNLFAIGPPGVGKETVLRKLIAPQAAAQPAPSDLCYVHDFGASGRPKLLALPPGRGAGFKADMQAAIESLRSAMRSAFDSEEYRTRKHELEERLEGRRKQALAEVQQAAAHRDVAVVQTDTGIALAPMRAGTPMDSQTFRTLPEAERTRRQAAIEEVGKGLQGLFQRLHGWMQDHLKAVVALDREMAASVAKQVVDGVRAHYADLPEILAHLDAVEADVVDSVAEILQGGGEVGLEAMLRQALERRADGDASLRRYQVNLLVEHRPDGGAPVVYEENPTYANLVGRLEHETQFGTLVTNFTLIKPGALHRAAGGYLLIDAVRVLSQPYAWDALKRTLRTGEIRIEPLGQAMGLVPTVSLEPEAVPLGETKVVLVGARRVYYLLAALDPDLLEQFKVLVDFEEDMDRATESEAIYADLVAALVGKEALRPFDRGAVARVIDEASRRAGDSEKLTVRMRGIADLLRESDYFAGEARRETVGAADVESAIEAARRRAGRVRERLLEEVRRGDIIVDTTGARVGQVNGLSVYQLGEHAFGHPTRITARVRLGKGEVVDIEREVALGGPIHSKGVLILGGFLGARYASGVPLSLSATLVFEQSYGAVEGDSASLGELCALLSALSEVPMRQSFALTGSTDQNGRVQAIGGVNEKIEGFFDVCLSRGLDGEQGVLIPRSNVKNLMLREDVVRAVREGKFQVHAVESVDEAVTLLAGRPAGERDAEGRFPDGSVNALVEARLVSLAEKARAFLRRQPTPEQAVQDPDR